VLNGNELKKKSERFLCLREEKKINCHYKQYAVIRMLPVKVVTGCVVRDKKKQNKRQKTITTIIKT
jgi:hypothetical protein